MQFPLAYHRPRLQDEILLIKWNDVKKTLWLWNDIINGTVISLRCLKMKTNKEICSYSVTKYSKLTISQSVKGHVWTLIKEGIHLNETVFQMHITWRYPEEYFFSLISSRPRAYDVPSQFFKATEVTAWKDLRNSLHRYRRGLGSNPAKAWIFRA